MRCAECPNNARMNSVLCGPCEDKQTQKSRIEELLDEVPAGPVNELLRRLAEHIGLV